MQIFARYCFLYYLCSCYIQILNYEYKVNIDNRAIRN